MKASIIIPAYNSEAYLGNCLESALEQTVDDIEVICVDDGSADSSRDIIRAYAESDHRVKAIVQDNRGGGAARNAGLDLATGDFLYFMDSDDWIEPDLIELSVAELERDSADLVVFPAYTVDDRTGEKWDTDWVFKRENIPDKHPFCYADMPDFIFNTFGNVPWNKVFRRSFVQSEGLRFQEIYRTNDLLFVCSALVAAKRITTIDEHLAYYRIGTLTNCQSTNEREPLGFYKAFLELKQYLEDREMYEKVKRSFLNHALDAVVSNLYTLKNPGAFSYLADKTRTEIGPKLGLDAEMAPCYRDSITYDLYSAIRNSDKGSDIFSWARVLQSQRDKSWRDYAKLREQKDEVISDLECKLAELSSRLDGVLSELSSFEASVSYKIGRTITSPYRALRTLMGSDNNR